MEIVNDHYYGLCAWKNGTLTAVTHIIRLCDAIHLIMFTPYEIKQPKIYNIHKCYRSM